MWIEACNKTGLLPRTAYMQGGRLAAKSKLKHQLMSKRVCKTMLKLSPIDLQILVAAVGMGSRQRLRSFHLSYVFSRECTTLASSRGKGAPDTTLLLFR